MRSSRCASTRGRRESIRSRSTARFGRRGVGRALLNACEAYGRRHRRSALTLEVRYDNAAAIALYESSGFRQFGEHARYYADGATALRYEKSLSCRPRRELGEQSAGRGRSTIARRIAPAQVGRKGAG